MSLIANHLIGRIDPPLFYSQGGFGTGTGGLTSFLTLIIELVVYAAAATTLIFLLIGSIQWMLSGGEAKAVSQARGKVTTAVIGLAVVLSTLAAIKLLEYFVQQPILP